MKTFLASLAALLTFILPVQAFAMTTPIFSVAGSSTNTATRFYAVQGGGFTQNISADSNARIPMPISGTFSNLIVHAAVAPGGTATEQFILFVNGSSTVSTLTCTLNSADTSCTDSTHSMHVSAGDTVDWQMVPTNTPATGTFTLSEQFDGDTADETFVAGASGSILSGSTANFPVTGGTNSAVEASTTVVMPTSGTIDHLYCQKANNVGVGQTDVVTLMVNDVASALVCTITGAVSQSSDLTHSVSINAGDTITYQGTYSAGTTNSATSAGFRFLPTIDGESPQLERQGVFTNGSRFNQPTGLGLNTSTENSASTTVPVAFIAKKGYMNLDVQPGVATGRLWTARKNGVSQTLAPTVSGASFTGNDTTHSDSFAAGDTIDFNGTVVSIPASGSYYRMSWVAYIAPNASTATHAYVMSLGQLFLNGFTIFY